MYTFKVVYQLGYPNSDSDFINECYVLAENFYKAQMKVEKRYEIDKFTVVKIIKMEILNSDIIV